MTTIGWATPGRPTASGGSPGTVDRLRFLVDGVYAIRRLSGTPTGRWMTTVSRRDRSKGEVPVTRLRSTWTRVGRRPRFRFGLVIAAIVVAGSVLSPSPGSAVASTLYVDKNNPSCSNSG